MDKEQALTEAVRFICEETTFAHGEGNAWLLVEVAAHDWYAHKTHLSHPFAGEEGEGPAVPSTSEERAFKSLLYWLNGDCTAVYCVLALFESAWPEQVPEEVLRGMEESRRRWEGWKLMDALAKLPDIAAVPTSRY